mgnify:CR=1 FL=1
MSEAAIRVCLETQRLILTTPGGAAQEWSVSTARNGPGEQLGSERTPRGRHVIRACIGAGLIRSSASPTGPPGWSR